VSRPVVPRGLRLRAGGAWLLWLLLLVPAAEAALRVAVISDLNGAYGSTLYEPTVGRAAAVLAALKPDLVISTGDMVAGQQIHPPLAEPQLQAMWSAFHRTVSEPLAAAHVPLAVTPGNHDASAYRGFELERRVFAREWGQRTPALEMVDAAGYPFDYAFALSGVLFVSLDVTRVGPIPVAQRDWLDTLLAARGGGYTHRVVFSHLPVYGFTQGRETDISADRALESILQKHRVDLYLSGHHHAFYPGYSGGVRYVSQACLGSAPRPLLGTQTRSARAVTWIEFDGPELRVRALTGPALREEIDFAGLPPSVSSRHGTLQREDLVPGLRQAAAGSIP
jgi:hypothetical protein